MIILHGFWKYLRQKKLTAISIIIIVVLASYIISGFINPLKVKEYTYTSSKVPEAFDGFHIVQISDFHCKEFGERESQLIQTIRNLSPDIIVFTGDSIDDEHTIDNYRYLLEGIHDVAPIYHINGNHEYDTLAPREEMEELHVQYGVTDLNDASTYITIDGESILLSGLDFRSTMKRLQSNITYADSTIFNVLLYHGTDQFDAIAPYNYDIVLAGHLHGGLICLPFVGGIVKNRSELFPKYNSGVYTVGSSTMISSRGLGDADLPRFHNPREVVSITLYTAPEDSE